LVLVLVLVLAISQETHFEGIRKCAHAVNYFCLDGEVKKTLACFGSLDGEILVF
jgi:hypothetical protein